MIPGRSPVLNTEPHTYMFPDITIDPTSPQSSKPRPPRAFASVGLILNPNISPVELNRFERILKCYTDYHHYTPPPQESGERMGTDVGQVGEGSFAAYNGPTYTVNRDSGQDSMAVVLRRPGEVEETSEVGMLHLL